MQILISFFSCVSHQSFSKTTVHSELDSLPERTSILNMRRAHEKSVIQHEVLSQKHYQTL